MRAKEIRISNLPFGMIGLAGLLLAAACPADAPQGGFPSNDDLRHVRAMAEPRLSPDGRHVLVRITDATADGGRSHLWLVDVALNTSRQLTFSPANDKQGELGGQWLGNGENILFLAKRGDHTQLFSLPMSGGEARVYDSKLAPAIDASAEADAVPPRKADTPASAQDPLPLDIEQYAAAPDGRNIAIIASDPETPGEKKQKDDKADALWLDHDLHGKRVFLLDPDTGKLTAVAVPPNVAALAWARQSDQFIAISEAPNHLADLGPARSAWLVRVAEPNRPTQLEEIPATIERGAWSADETHFYYLAQTEADTPPGHWDLYTFGIADRTIRNLTRDFSGSIGSDAPTAVDADVLQLVETGVHSAYIRIRGGKTELLRFATPVVTGLHVNATHTGWVWLGQSGAQAATLYFTERLDRPARALSTPSLLPGSWPAANPRVIRWSSDGLSIEGLLYLPPQASSAKVPLIVDVHGGPTGVWLDSYNPLTEFLLGQGWAVLKPNPRGSSAYGKTFVAANRNDLGGGDYRDIMTGVDAVIAQYPIDANRLALIGYSYGGEMAGFVEGKTDRFKAIVSGAPVIDQHSEYGTEDDSWYDRWFYGKPWEHAEDAWRQSPLAGVAHAKTPFLLIQGEGDTVDPLGQSLEMYRALRQAGVHVEMVQYPRDNHGPLSAGLHGFPSAEPWHGFDARQHIVKFIKAAFEAPK